MKRINITINEDGSSVVTTEGFRGQACTKEIEKLNLGLKQYGLQVDTKDIKFTAEYSQPEDVKQKITA